MMDSSFDYDADDCERFASLIGESVSEQTSYYDRYSNRITEEQALKNRPRRRPAVITEPIPVMKYFYGLDGHPLSKEQADVAEQALKNLQRPEEKT